MIALALDAAAAPLPEPEKEHVLVVHFKSAAGLRWAAVGGGPTVAQAIESARAALPGGTWIAVDWNDLYGD